MVFQKGELRYINIFISKSLILSWFQAIVEVDRGELFDFLFLRYFGNLLSLHLDLRL